MSDAPCQVRPAGASDAAAVADLASELAQSFIFAWVEEVFVGGQHRGCGVGRALMSAYEQWATSRDCALVALATRRAAPFYRALGYEESAIYHRKILDARAGQ